MAVPDQIKETTITKVSIATGDFDAIALAKDPDRVLLIIHNDSEVLFNLAITSTPPTDATTMVKYRGTEHHVYFTTHVPTETVYIWHGESGPINFWIEHASR
jgi:hypothetical protein